MERYTIDDFDGERLPVCSECTEPIADVFYLEDGAWYCPPHALKYCTYSGMKKRLILTPIQPYEMMDECPELAIQGADAEAHGLHVGYYRVHGDIEDHWYCAYAPETGNASISCGGETVLYHVPTIEAALYRYFGTDIRITMVSP